MSKDTDDLYGDDIIVRLEICVRRNGSMSVAGDIHDEKYAKALLDNAKDAIKHHHARLNNGKKIITPAYDTPLAN